MHYRSLSELGKLIRNNFRSLLLGNHNLEAVEIGKVSSGSLGLDLLGPGGGLPRLKGVLLLLKS